MKVFEHLKSEWFRYGFETLAVIVGILAAFALDSWNDTRKSKDLKQELLNQFITDLHTDIESIDEVNAWHDSIIFSCEVLVDHLKNRMPFNDSLKKHFDMWNDFETLVFSSGAISNQNSRGVELISDVDLRNHILQLYNKYYPHSLKDNQYFREDHVQITYKIQLDRIEPIQWQESAMPNDYEALFDDQVFINHVQWIRNAAMFNQRENEDLIHEINAVIEHIEQVQNKE